MSRYDCSRPISSRGRREALGLVAKFARLNRIPVLALVILLSACAGPKRFSLVSAGHSRADPLLKKVMRWMDQRDYRYTLFADENETTIISMFAEEPGELPACTCVISTANDMVMVTAFLLPEMPPGLDGKVVSWLTDANFETTWGFFGYLAETREVWFRIAIFRPERNVTTPEMDRLLEEVVSAMHKTDQFLKQTTEPPGETDTPQHPEPQLEVHMQTK